MWDKTLLPGEKGSGELTLPVTNTYGWVYKGRRGEVTDFSDYLNSQIVFDESFFVHFS